MKIRSLVKEKKFIPEFNGNKELADKEQIVVNIKRFPGISDLGKIKAFKYDASGNVIINYDNSYVLKTFVGGISNIDLEAGIDPVTNGSSLATTEVLELEPLVSEIRTYIMDTLEVMEEGEGVDSE
jgi:hypothetical protein